MFSPFLQKHAVKSPTSLRAVSRALVVKKVPSNSVKTYYARSIGGHQAAIPFLIAVCGYAYPWSNDVLIALGVYAVTVFYMLSYAPVRQFYSHYKWLLPVLVFSLLITIFVPILLYKLSNSAEAILTAEIIPVLVFALNSLSCGKLFKLELLDQYGWECRG